MIATAGCETADAELVAAVRAGDDSAFEELYRRYQPRIARFVCSMLHDAARCEDVAQEAFLSALRRMRETDAEINFKPWIYQIARNAAIDSYRRNSHTVEVSMDADDGLRASDRTRLVGLDGSPDAALITKERLDHLQGAFDELSDVHTRVLVMRELEGMSYREMARSSTSPARPWRAPSPAPAAGSRASTPRLSEGRRCEAMALTIARIAQGVQRGSEEQRLAATRAAATAAAAAPASLESSRCRRWARCARRQPRCSRCRGCCAARAETAVGSRDSSERARTQPRWRSALRLFWPWQRWPVREARRSVLERYRGTARKPGTAASRWSGPRRAQGNCSAAPRSCCHGRRASGNPPVVRAEGFRSGGGPRRRFNWQ